MNAASWNQVNEDFSRSLKFASLSHLFDIPVLGSKLVFPAAWKPAFDGPYLEDPMFPEDPSEVIEKGKTLPVPLMIGFNRDEGLLTLAFMLKNRTHFQRFT